jgi:DNA-binding transcriptional LysR family regulator
MEPPGSVMHGAVETYLAERGLEMPAMPVSTTSLMMTLGFVLNSQAVGVMSAPAARLFATLGGGTGAVRVLDVAPGLAVAPFAIVTLRDRRPGPALETFLAILRQELQRRAGGAG